MAPVPYCHVAVAGDDWVVALGYSNVPDTEEALVKLRLDAAGGILEQQMLAWTGDPSFPFGGSPTPLSSLNSGPGASAIDVNRSGDVIWHTRYDGGFTDAIYVNRLPVIIKGELSSLPGRLWEFESNATRTAINDDGDWAALLRVSNPSERALVKNGQVYAVSGDIISAYDQRVLGGLSWNTSVGGITPEGAPVWLGGFYTPSTGLRQDCFCGRESVFSTDDVTPGGFEIDLITGVEVAPDGRYALATVRNTISQFGPEALVRVEMPLGERYGQPVPSSVGEPSELTLYGSPSVADNDIELEVGSLPAGTFGYGLASQSRGSVPFVGGSQGTLLLSSTIQRLPNIVQASPSGVAVSPLDLTMPLNGGQSFAAGTTWHFQFWYRDANPQPTSNFSNGVTVSLR